MVQSAFHLFVVTNNEHARLDEINDRNCDGIHPDYNNHQRTIKN